jgi:hypothetical protein
VSCRTIAAGHGVTMILCGRRDRETCQTPGCNGTMVALCDFALSGKSEGKTCDRKLCAKCRRLQGPNVDFCAAHDTMAKASR